MSTTVLAPSGLEISSNDSSKEEMLKSLTPPSGDKSPRVLVDKGKTVKPIPDKDAAEGDDTSRAASVLGKKGGEAAAKARALAEKAKGKDAAKDATETATGDEKGKAEAKGDEETETDAAAKEAADKKKGNPRHDPEARVREATREAREARERAERAERELAQERRARTDGRGLAAEESRKTGEAPAGRDDGRPQPPPKPKPDDFNTYEEYLDARDEHTRQSMRHEQQQQEGAHRHARAVTSAVDAFNKRMSEATEADPSLMDSAKDFAAGLRPSFAMAKGEKLGPEHVIADHIITSDHGPALLRHFAEDGGLDGPEFQRIATLGGPTEIRLGLAKLEGRLEAATADTSTSREVSRAGSPVRSVAGSPHAAEPDVHGDIPFDVFMARKAKK